MKNMINDDGTKFSEIEHSVNIFKRLQQVDVHLSKTFSDKFSIEPQYKKWKSSDIRF